MTSKHKHETKAPEPTSTSISEPGPAGPEGPAGPPGPPGTVHPLSAAFLADEFGRLGGRGGRNGGALQRLFLKWVSNPDKDTESIANPLKELIEHRATELSKQTGVKIEPLDYIQAVNRFQHLLETVF